MGIHLGGPAAGNTVLSLGSQVINSGPGWSASKPLCVVVVSTNERYRLGAVLPAIPKNAIPVDVFFRK